MTAAQIPHRLTVHVDEWGTTPWIECPFDPADDKRPCRLGREAGNGYAPDPDDLRCALVGWIEDGGPDLSEVFQFEALVLGPIDVVIPHGWGDEAPTIEQVTSDREETK